MSPVDWYIEGVEVTNCNCDYACPCQFESSRPTHGDCRGFAAVRIDKGHFGDVALDGLCAALLYGWPGPIYEGNGECQAVVDERADALDLKDSYFHFNAMRQSGTGVVR